jgi:gliding motility-associated-like protein
MDFKSIVVKLIKNNQFYSFTYLLNYFHTSFVGLVGQPGAKISIFDRYGKLLKQISSTGAGWDGTYNGYLMPSDDYWFTVD